MKTAITDLRVLNKYSKRFGLKFDREFKYILNEYSLKTEKELRKENLFIVYISGCFYPFLYKDASPHSGCWTHGYVHRMGTPQIYGP